MNDKLIEYINDIKENNLTMLKNLAMKIGINTCGCGMLAGYIEACDDILRFINNGMKEDD